MNTSLLKSILKRVPGQQEAVGLLRLAESYLTEIGWMDSYKNGRPMDASGNPLPWLTYPCINFLSERLTKDIKVFEYGSGNSTIWLSSRVGEVVSTEHEKEWFDIIKPSIDQAPNVTYHFRDLADGSYVAEVTKYPGQFDLVIIDGRERVACAKNALASLTDRGVILWDNADREKYRDGYAFLVDKGFRRLDFWGISPSSHVQSSTAIFYRDGNCLGL